MQLSGRFWEGGISSNEQEVESDWLVPKIKMGWEWHCDSCVVMTDVNCGRKEKRRCRYKLVT